MEIIRMVTAAINTVLENQDSNVELLEVKQLVFLLISQKVVVIQGLNQEKNVMITTISHMMVAVEIVKLNGVGNVDKHLTISIQFVPRNVETVI